MEERGMRMLNKRINEMEVDLKLFDEGGAAAPAGNEGGQAETGGSTETGDAGQGSEKNTEKPIVKYGKQPEDTIDNQNEDTKKEGDQENPNQKSESETGEVDQYDLDNLLKSNENVKKQFDQKIQNIINKRFKESKEVEERMSKVDPVLDLLKERYGAEETDQLLEMLENETYEELAYKNNMDPDKYKEYKQTMKENEQLKEQVGKTNSEESDKQVQERVKGWYDEAEAIKEEYPDFDLKEASKDRDFLSLLKSGVGVKAAFQATNFDDILSKRLSAATQKTKENTIESIKSKKNRISEGGSHSAPGVVVKNDVRKLTKEDRQEIVKRSSEGESISF